jgi:ribosomal protein L9
VPPAAPPAAIKEFEARRAELEKAAADKLAAAQALGEKLAARPSPSPRRPVWTAACSAR